VSSSLPILARAARNGDGIHIFGISKNELHPEGCARCDQAKRIVGEELGRAFTFWDIDTPEGMVALAKCELNSLAERHLPIIRIGDKTFDVLGQAVKYIKSNGHGVPDECVSTTATQAEEL
jgi:hypothetical protein